MIIFRSDASIEIGVGHIMRCLRLANALTERYGVKCEFICGDQKGNYIEYIRQNGFNVSIIKGSGNSELLKNDECSDLKYYRWLGTNWKNDAEQTKRLLYNKKVDWLVIDHYAIDTIWESTLRPHTKKIMVIDDLADRVHNCDLLLDQNLVENFENRYQNLIPENCKTLLGSQFALLSPDYAKIRSNQLSRSGNINRILIFFGGSDKNNFTKLAISALLELDKDNLIIDVIIDFNSSQIKEIRKLSKKNKNIFIYNRLKSLAPLMSKADLAIGAGGSTTWERCCLGLPTIILICETNQKPIAESMKSLGAAIVLNPGLKLETEIKNSVMYFLNDDKQYLEMSKKAFSICDGKGINRVIDNLI